MEKRAPLSLAEKDYLYRRKQAGASHAEVAQELHCARETVRKKWQAFRRGQPQPKRGRPSLGILSTYPAEISQKAIEIKKAHACWGPANVLLELQSYFGERYPSLPSPSRLSALFKAQCPQAVQSHQPSQPPEHPPPVVVARVHQRWQLDAKEKIHLGDGEFASLLEIRDPVGALMIASQAFLTTLTPSTYRKLTWPEIQASLRQAFSQWGRPAEIQTDHEDVYAGANRSDFPMPFTLWLVGLGIRHVFSRSRRPTDQPQIERNHRTLAELTWKNQPPTDLENLQRQLEAGRARYNQRYPAQAANCQGLPPLVRHPQAVHSGRPYQVQSELALFDLQAVDHYLAQFCWVRKVDQNGILYLGNLRYYLGKGHPSQAVKIRFQPERRAFRFETEAGEWIKTLPAKGLEKADLTGLIPGGCFAKTPLQLTLPRLAGV